jgi:DNA-binding beta-propeller fold protein YncE
MSVVNVGISNARLLVTSAAGANGGGYGALLAFDLEGRSLGAFSGDHRIVDPRGLGVHRDQEVLFLNSGADRVLALDRHGKVLRDTGPIKGLNPGGGNFNPDGQYCVGSRSARTIVAFPTKLESSGEPVLPAGIVPFPRGFAFGRDGRLFLASGIGPNGMGDDAIVAFGPAGRMLTSWRVKDPELSPLDLAIAPNDNILVSSEYPFGATNAVTTVREYDARDGHLVRVFSPSATVGFRKPRGLRFGPDGRLYCVARDEVVAFDFETGKCHGAVVTLPRLNGQALIFFP